MKMKFGIKEVVATGIGTALFVALTEVHYISNATDIQTLKEQDEEGRLAF